MRSDTKMANVLLDSQARGSPTTAPRQAPCTAPENPGWLEIMKKLRGELRESCIDILEPMCVGWCAARLRTGTSLHSVTLNCTKLLRTESCLSRQQEVSLLAPALLITKRPAQELQSAGVFRTQMSQSRTQPACLTTLCGAL